MTNELTVLTELHAREAEYWDGGEHNPGRSAPPDYAGDGTFAIGDKVFTGREEIAGFYRWRAELGTRTARHVVTNPRVSELTETSATFCSIMLLYADNGVPVLESKPAVMIADVESAYVRAGEAWVLRSRVLRPIFEGGVGATVPK